MLDGYSFINRWRTKVLEFPSLFSSGCALFHFPYPLSPLLATLTKTAGCVPTIPRLELLTRLPRAKPRGYSPISNHAVLKFFLFTLLRTLLRFLALSENSTLLFSSDSALLAKNTGGWGEGLWKTPGTSLSGNASSPDDTTRLER